jgi:esterase/lipase superfamily enzyme
MGSMVVMEALSIYGRRESPRKLGWVVMAAADVPVDHFRAQLERIEKVVSGLTIYVSSRDRAIAASRIAARGDAIGSEAFDYRPMDVRLNVGDIIDISKANGEIFVV